MTTRPRPLCLVWVALAALLCSGCDTDCGCDAQYEDCLAKAPPGAAKADCAQAHDRCEEQCDASRSAEEAELGMR